MKMRIPPYIKVGPNVYRVSWHKELNQPGSDQGCLGITHPYLKEIHLLTGLEEQTAMETFIHELLHACSSFMEIPATGKLEEEEFVTRLAPALYMVLVDNANRLFDLTTKKRRRTVKSRE